MFELRRYCHLNLIPRQPCGQHRQRIVQIDHGVNSAAEKVNWLHPKIPQKVTLLLTFLGGFGAPRISKKLVFMRACGVLQGRLFSGASVPLFLARTVDNTKADPSPRVNKSLAHAPRASLFGHS
jgi:hypothetical protein